MRNVEEVRLIRNTKNTLTLGLAALIAPEQELNTIKQAAVGVLSLRRAPKLGKLLMCIASIRSSCDLRPPPNRKGLGPRVPIGVRGSVSPTSLACQVFHTKHGRSRKII